MILAEALDAGTITVGAVLTLVAIVGSGAWWASATSSKLASIAKDTSTTARGQRDLARALDDHRVEDEARHAEQGSRLTRLEIVAELTPIHGIQLDRPPTGPQARLRGDTPKPRRHEDTGETGPGESR